MTFSRRRCLLALVLLGVSSAWAGLGENESSIVGDRLRMRATHSLAHATQYTLHELQGADGSRITQYVTGNGKVFAVTWHTLYKPDLSSLLGRSYAAYTGAAHDAARHGGMQRQFLHHGSDLVVQSSGHMSVYSGFAYRRSLLPPGINLQTIGLG